jgi:hypothetical protein
MLTEQEQESDLSSMLQPGSWDWSLDEDRIRCDRRFAELYSLDPERLARGTTLAVLLDRIHPEDRDYVAALARVVQQVPGERSVEYRIHSGEGSRWLYCRGCTLVDGAGRPYRVTGIVLDVSTFKRQPAQTAAHRRRGDALGQISDLVLSAHTLAKMSKLSYVTVLIERVLNELGLRLAQSGRRGGDGRQPLERQKSG